MREARCLETRKQLARVLGSKSKILSKINNKRASGNFWKGLSSWLESMLSWWGMRSGKGYDIRSRFYGVNRKLVGVNIYTCV